MKYSASLQAKVTLSTLQKKSGLFKCSDEDDEFEDSNSDDKNDGDDSSDTEESSSSQVKNPSEGTESNASTTPASSSSMQSSASTTPVVSPEGVIIPDKDYVNDPTLGSCGPTVSSSPRGSATSWTYTKGSGITLAEMPDITVSWTFPEAQTSYTTGNLISGVSFSKVGYYAPIVSVGDRGNILYSPIEITAATESCTCTPTNATININTSNSATWNLSCRSLADITSVEWSNDVTPESNKYSVSKSISSAGTVSGPTHTVKNEDGRTTSGTCPSVTAKDIPEVDYIPPRDRDDAPLLPAGIYSFYVNDSQGAIVFDGSSSTDLKWATDSKSGDLQIRGYYTKIFFSKMEIKKWRFFHNKNSQQSCENFL